MEPAVVETENLVKRFRRHDAVRGVNLRVPEGATFALVGANGAGKTTTLRMLVNILRPDVGRARVLGIDTLTLAPNDFLRIGYVSENQELPSGLWVGQYLDYLRSLYPNWDRALENELCNGFGLPRSQLIGKLSHGMLTKLKLTAALAFHPKLLILDEPLSGLDPLTRDEVMAGILRQASETTIVISSHELAELEGCTTHVAFMDRGQIAFQETIESLSARFREVNVTLPQPVADLRCPNTWIGVEAVGAMLRFVDVAYRDDQALRQQLVNQFGTVTHVDTQPMSLRDISKALMRAARTETAR
jgi:ABC-2 type transport system ATP-binding protein